MKPTRVHRQPRRPQRGFTIIELMITAVIVAILAAIGVPSFNNLILSTRIKNGASDIYGALILARSEAIKRGANVTITPVAIAASVGPPAIVAVPLNWANGWQVAVGAAILRNQDPLTKLKIECPAGTPCISTITYRRDGRLSGTTTISIVVDEETPPSPRRVPNRCVTISVSGQVNVLADNNLDGNCLNG